MDTKTDGPFRLNDSWRRLENLCRRLWDADSPVAVDMQAVVEEYKGEVHRCEQTISTLRTLQDELRDTVARETQRRFTDEIDTLRTNLKETQSRCESLEASVNKKDARIQELMKELATKEAVNLEFHEKFLKASTEQDEARSRKMEAFYKELMQKETELEARWVSRHDALEAEHKQRTELLKKKHDELLSDLKARAASLEEHFAKREAELEQAQEKARADREAWESARLAESLALSKRKDELAAQTESLAAEYRAKQTELQRIKDSLQRELAEVVRQYQTRMRGGGN